MLKSNTRLSAVDAPSNNNSPLCSFHLFFTSDQALHAAKKATNWLALRGLRKGLCCTKTRTSGEIQQQQQRKSKSQCTFLGLAVTFLSINILIFCVLDWDYWSMFQLQAHMELSLMHIRSHAYNHSTRQNLEQICIFCPL